MTKASAWPKCHEPCSRNVGTREQAQRLRLNLPEQPGAAPSYLKGRWIAQASNGGHNRSLIGVILSRCIPQECIR